MRLLVDEHALEWEEAWKITQQVCTYTNHTLMPEALEVWPLDLMRRLLPRHMEIIEELNRRLLAKPAVAKGREELQRRVSLIDNSLVNMGRLSVLASHRVNGVSGLHSRLVREDLFPDYAHLYPDRFDNVTNGITPRRWLMQANPGLSGLLDDTIGPAWRRDFAQIIDFAKYAGDKSLGERLHAVRRGHKDRLARRIAELTGVRPAPEAMFDVQIKRIHEYKRQLLNVLGVIARWNEMKAEPRRNWAPRVIIMAGKAASAYWLAKCIIKLAYDVGVRINGDPATSDRLKFVFLPNYNVSLAEAIIPAADLSQQISLAGTEASGTGNMKLALNGALTLGTADGANIEIAECVGDANVFFFGMGVTEVNELRAAGYAPREVYERDSRVREAVDQIASGAFSPEEPGRHRPIVQALLEHGDRYMVLADFAAYLAAQEQVDALWADPSGWISCSIRNIAGMARFSSDRAIREYATRIWNIPSFASRLAERE
jgi:starch phosphorylase